MQHITIRTNSGMLLFEADAERRLFLGLLQDITALFEWTCATYCLMPNHVHLLVLPSHANLGDGMQRLTMRYARYYNERRARHGHVFQGRYWSRPVVGRVYLRRVMRYIALNPVRAGLVAHAADYPWSAHRSLLGLTRSSLVAQASDPEAYEAFVGDEAADSAFSEIYERLPDDSPTRREHLAELARNLDRDTLIVAAHMDHGYSLTAIARELGCAPSTVGRRLKVLIPPRTHGA